MTQNFNKYCTNERISMERIRGEEEGGKEESEKPW